jgi:hypothetical protein
MLLFVKILESMESQPAVRRVMDERKRLWQGNGKPDLPRCFSGRETRDKLHEASPVKVGQANSHLRFSALRRLAAEP